MAYPLASAAGSESVPSSPSFPDLEAAVLRHWAQDRTFEASVEARPVDGPAGEYVFYDGPPFANGLPHYGHLLTGYVKDVVPRYRTMRGQRVERRFGCSGSACGAGASGRPDGSSRPEVSIGPNSCPTSTGSIRGVGVASAMSWSRM